MLVPVGDVLSVVFVHRADEEAIGSAPQDARRLHAARSGAGDRSSQQPRSAQRKFQSRPDGGRGAMRDGPARRGRAMARRLPQGIRALPSSSRADCARRLARCAGPNRTRRRLVGVLRGGAQGSAMARRAGAMERALRAGNLRFRDARRDPGRPRSPGPCRIGITPAADRTRDRAGLLGGNLPEAADRLVRAGCRDAAAAKRSSKSRPSRANAADTRETLSLRWQRWTSFPSSRR